jgi:hypothetical protein
MRIATTLLASCALLVSVPAAAQSPPPLVANCKPTSAEEAKKGINNCDVTVIMPAGCGSGIQVAPDPIIVEGPATITWKIRSSGTWVFADDGIQIRSATGREYSPPTKDSRDSTVFTARRLAREAGILKYDINLKRGTTETCKHDPTVINQ